MEIEKDSYWFNHRNDIILNFVKKYSSFKNFLDIGGGNGFVSKRLQDEGVPTILLEPGIDGVLNAKNRGVENIIQGSLETIKFNSNSMSSVGIFDVLEHIKDDINFLLKIKTCLKKSGKLYLTVPSYNYLWSKDDNDAGHFRRYSFGGLKDLIESSGFNVIFQTYFFSFLPIPIFLFRTIPSFLGFFKNKSGFQRNKNEHKLNGKISYFFLEKILNWELNRIKKNKKIYFGSSIFLIATKK